MAKPRASHFPGEPKGFIVLRFFQLVFSIIVLGLSAYSVYFWQDVLAGSGPILSIFTSLASIITIIYIFVATFGAQAIYNYWAILGLEIFLVVFWLISFAVTAARTAALAAYYGTGETCDYLTDICLNSGVGIGAMGGTAGIGGLVFIFFVVSLAIYATFLVRHRNAGGHSTPGRIGGVAPQAYEPHSTAPESKIEMQPQHNTNPIYGQQQQTSYAPQTQFQQHPQYMQPQPTGTTGISSPSTPANQYQQPAQYAPPAQYENGPQQLDSNQQHYVHQ